MRRAAIVVASVMLAAGGGAGCTVANYPIIASTPAVTASSCPAAPQSTSKVGLFAGNETLTALESQTGLHPSWVLSYPEFGGAFKTTAYCAEAQNGAYPIIQMDPYRTSLADVAAGKYDSYLRTYAQNVAAFRTNVIISLGHEMNGDWYTWGWRHTSPATFVAAWQHVVTVFRAQKATNVIWMWTVDEDPESSLPLAKRNVSPPAAWWPGSAYVSMIGIDGYYLNPSDTFAKVFGHSLAEVARYHVPILLSEVGVGPNPDAATQIANLFAGAKAAGVTGVVWFDTNGSQDYRLENRPAALAAFRTAAASFAIRSP